MHANELAAAIGTKIAKIAHSCSRFSVRERANRRGKNDDSRVFEIVFEISNSPKNRSNTDYSQ